MAGIYIHIPFCRQACNYCNFHFSVYQGNKQEFLKCLLLEIEMQRDFLPAIESHHKKISLESIYLGGGTPSLLSSAELLSIFNKLKDHYVIDQNAEITLEANPDDLSPAFIEALRATPVNRLSIGIQSFHDDDLRYMNRAHNSGQARKAIEEAMEAGFNNLTIDLIYGTPTLSDKQWKENVMRVISLGVPHISAYALTVEKKTALEVFIRRGKATPVDEEQTARQFEILIDLMKKNGYLHYEISNFCKPGYYSKHNLSYWTGKPYLGLGPSAHSFKQNQRWWNISNTCAYIASIEKCIIPCEHEVLSPTQQLDEYVMTSLRTMWGCSLPKVEQKWGTQKAESLLGRAQQFIASGHMLNNDSCLQLTENGKLFADGIAAELFEI